MVASEREERKARAVDEKYIKKRDPHRKKNPFQRVIVMYLSNSLHHSQHSSVEYSDLSNIVASLGVHSPASTKARVPGCLFRNRCEQY